jgi:DUF4097 and DUF4098 domain-containing protein YvlB
MTRLLIRLIALAVVASLPIPLHAQKPAPITEKISKSFKVGPGGALDVSNVSGDVTVTEGGTDTIVIDAVKKLRGSASEAKDQFARVTIEMVERGGRVEAKTTYAARNTKVSVDYTVTAPAGTSVSAHTMSGDVKVTNIKGEVRIDTVSGDVTATGTPAATLVRTMSGDATASGIDHQNELRVSTLSGTVIIRSARARAVDADSTSGDVSLADVICDRALVKAFSGDITYSGSLAKAGRYEFKSQSGDIRITLAGAPGFELDASTFSGSVRSDFPVTVPPGQPIGGQGARKSLRGVVGPGGAMLAIRAFSGDITITKK